MSMPADASCPVDLHYAEPEPVRLDLTAILAGGRRLRRQRRLARAAAVVVACAIIAGAVPLARVVSSGLTTPAHPGALARPGPGVSQIDGMLAVYPPVGGRATVLSQWPGHWTGYAWAIRNGDVCWAFVPAPAQTGSGQEYCPATGSGFMAGSGSLQLSVSGVDPYGQPVYRTPGRSGLSYYPVAGLVPARASRVVLTIYGRTFPAAVARVPLPGRRGIGAFLAWIHPPAGAGVHGLGGSFVTREVAYDAGGHVVARHGSWAPPGQP